jgi:hypothetical protein
MDLQQRKLTKDEWDSVERPMPESEMRIIQLIQDAYSNVTLKRNQTPTILQHLKVQDSDAIDRYVYTKYLQKDFKKVVGYSKSNPIEIQKVKSDEGSVKKRDIMRFANTDAQLEQIRDSLFEYIVLDILKTTLKQREKNNESWPIGCYTLCVLTSYSVTGCNRTFFQQLSSVLVILRKELNTRQLVYHGHELIEENPFLLKYADEELYDHQKRLFTVMRNAVKPQLVLYIAPTGTGKTMSPLGLLQGHRVIFVCAARHVGLALAKAAISAGRKVAFGFGCGDAEDIRLHYAAAADYTKNRKTGGIFRVDNSNGTKVELMICDVKSYLPAMNYMLAFNEVDELITYWDEPTITLDYDYHPCHADIQKNWVENRIPKMVLSSATLPQEGEMMPTIMDFRARFAEAEITSILSYDCKKTIPILDRTGKVATPHSLYGDDYRAVRKSAMYCIQNKTMLRYIDLGKAIALIELVNEKFPDAIEDDRYAIDTVFTEVESVNMLAIKNNYLHLLTSIDPDQWPAISQALVQINAPKLGASAGVKIATDDAHTLTDGPTIYLADDVDKIAKFCLQTAKIPTSELQCVAQAMAFNSTVNDKLVVMKKRLEDLTATDEDKDNKMASESRGNPEVKDLRKKIAQLEGTIKTVSLPSMYIPNKAEHLKRFVEDISGKEFKPDVPEEAVEQIMLVHDIEDHWKLLLMMGIGVFAKHDSPKYTEIMKNLAQQQKLYLIIASTDYIYGTNYQFCHGYIGKDLEGMSQEKAIQAMGRVGRNKLQFTYSLRFRDDDIIRRLFEHDSSKPEVANMARLFNE